jgi:hypothetical protein
VATEGASAGPSCRDGADTAVPDVLGSYLARGWAVDQEGRWHVPSRDDSVTTLPSENPQLPLRDDSATATISCPVCQQPFARQGKRRWCSDACRSTAWRRGRQASPPALVVPPARPRRPFTVYECDSCGTRAVGQQRCKECGTFMRKLGLGGACPHCDEPVAVTELLDQEVMRKG